MENKVKSFINEVFGEVRTVVIDEKVWFMANDCLKILEYGESGWRTKIKRLKEKGVTKCNVLTNGGIQSMNFINEPNLYNLVFGSKMNKAEDFQDWILETVIPTIRKDGMYVSGEEEVESVEELNELVSEAMERKILRKFGIGIRKDLASIMVKNWITDPKKTKVLGTWTNELVYKPLFGKKASELKKEHGVKDLRDKVFTEEQLVKICDIEKEVALLIDFGQDYYSIKEFVKRKYSA